MAAILDTRHQQEGKKTPIAIRVTYQRAVWYYATGIKLPLTDTGDTLKDYDGICKAKGTKGKYSPTKMEIQSVFDKVKTTAQKLNNSPRGFSLAALKDELKPTVTTSGTRTLYEEWLMFAGSKTANKTREQYKQAAVSFFKSLGCKTGRVLQEDGRMSRRMELTGRKLNLKPSDLTPSMIDGWSAKLAEEGKTQASIAIYTRPLRALIHDMERRGVIKEAFKVTVSEGERRQDNYLKVPDIRKIWEYEGEGKEWADWWMIVYFCNGCNLKDLSELRYTNDYTYNNELTFVRSKTKGKSPSRVYIPITEPLKELMEKYAAPYSNGAFVFPRILAGAVSESAKDNRVHDFNAAIREGMKTVCKNTEIIKENVTTATARNSYITTLSWHQVSDNFIDNMTGHVTGNKVLRGYQGQISPKLRLKYNNLLLIDPEEENE